LSVQLGNLGSHREIESLVSEIDNETTENRFVNLVLNDETLSVLCDLGSLERLLETFLEILLERGSGGDGDLDLASVSRHDFEEVGDDLVGFVQSTVVGEDFEEVLGEVGSSLGGRLLEESFDTGGLVGVGEDGVGEEILNGSVTEGSLDTLEVGLDLVQSTVEDGSQIELWLRNER